MQTEIPPTGGHAADSEFGFLDVALVVAKHLKLLVFGPLLVGLIALGVSFLVKPTFSARAVVLPPQPQQSSAAAALQNLGALAGLAGGAAVRTPADQYVALMQSATVEDRLVAQFDLKRVYDEELQSEARQKLEANSRISAGKKDGLLVIEVDDHDPARAAAMANAYVEQLRRLTSELAITEAQQRRLFFERQLAQTKERFAAAQKALESAGISEGALRAEPKAAAEGYARLLAEATATEVRIQALRGYLADGASELIQAQRELGALRTQLSRLESVNQSASKGDYIDRFREFKYQETLFDLFARQFEMAKLDESREGTVIQVVDAASPPERKSKPRKALIAIFATVASFFLIALWVFLRHVLAHAMQSADAGKRASLRRSLGRGNALP
jgi:tyrosine-protein kinase Etk/Wzc